MELSNVTEFDEIYKIMEEAFPPIERRSYDKQKELFKRSHYHVHTLKAEMEIKAFIAIWEFPAFIFVEHLAIAAPYRNQGLGAQLLKEVMQFYRKWVVLEVELPQTELAARRIGFYERLGFIANKQYNYQQPPLQKGFSSYPLWLMTYPDLLDNQAYAIVKKQLYEDVYGIESIS